MSRESIKNAAELEDKTFEQRFAGNFRWIVEDLSRRVGLVEQITRLRGNDQETLKQE